MLVAPAKPMRGVLPAYIGRIAVTEGMMAGDLAGQVAIVTGGGRGIGRAIAQRLAAAGAAVTITAHTEEQLQQTVSLIEQEGGRALAVTADVCDPEAVAHVVAETEQQLGPVDILVNNAGFPGTPGPLWEVDPDDWWRSVEVNLRGSLLYARAVLPGMLARRRGHIINVTSQVAYSAYPYVSSYAAAKAATVRLSESLAFETKDAGIAVFSMNPGGVHTTMTDEFFGSPAGRRWLPGMMERIKHNNTPPDHAVALCLLLATGAADALSGRSLGVEDDVPSLVEQAQELRESERYLLRRRL
jgi:NAD(P)-dependent dehydrogenase (short-subunit alcohol dehydrogenase family)